MLVGLLTVAAARPVAMRVEVAPLRAEGEGTAVELVIQVAPEDRARIGRTLWLQGELTRNGTTVVRLARGVELDEQGRVQLELTLEHASYNLRIELQAGQGGGSGFWQGRVVVPRMEPGETPPTPAAASAVAGKAPAAQVGGQGEPTGRSEPSPAPETAPTPESENARTTDISAVGQQTAVPTVVEAPVQPTPAPPLTVASQGHLEAPSTAAVPAAAAAGGETRPEPASAEPAPTPSTAAPRVAAAEVVAPTPAPAAAPASRPEVPSRNLERWGTDAPGLWDLTVWVSDRGRPIGGLERGAFRVELNGDQAAIEDFGDASRAPLYLGFAVHVAPETLRRLPGLEALVGRLAIQASGEGGSALVAADDGSGSAPTWGASPDQVAALLRSSMGAGRIDLAGMIAAALDGLAGRRGRRVLVVVADGGDSAGRSGWKSAVDRAESAGIPILVVGVEGGRLESATRKGLERVEDASGGAAYFLRLNDSGLLELVADLYADTVAATYDLRVARPASGDAAKVKVEVLGGRTEVRHSRRLRQNRPPDGLVR